MNRVTDDLISRVAARDVINTWGRHENEVVRMKLLHDDLDAISAVDAVPVVHGRWIKMTGMMPPEYHGHYECSECGWHMKGLRNSWTREEEFSYCPNCGIKMETKN